MSNDRYERIRKALAMGPMQGPWGATLRDLLAERDALAAENEALRAEVATWEGLHASEVQVRQRWQARAERLEEALALLPDEIVMVEHNPYEGPLMFCCGQRVTSGGLHDLLINHSKECWYARMRALRDHDQENKA